MNWTQESGDKNSQIKSRVGSTLMKHRPLEFDKRMMYQSVDFDHNNPTMANGTERGLNIRSKQMMNFYNPGYNQKLMHALHGGDQETARSNTAHQTEKFYQTISDFKRTPNAQNTCNDKSPRDNLSASLQISPKSLQLGGRKTALGSTR